MKRVEMRKREPVLGMLMENAPMLPPIVQVAPREAGELEPRDPWAANPGARPMPHPGAPR